MEKFQRFDPDRCKRPIGAKNAGCDGHDLRLEAIKLIPTPGKLDRAALVCCEICEEVIMLHHAEAEQALSRIQALGWKKIEGKWRCSCC